VIPTSFTSFTRANTEGAEENGREKTKVSDREGGGEQGNEREGERAHKPGPCSASHAGYLAAMSERGSCKKSFDSNWPEKAGKKKEGRKNRSQKPSRQ
jgi:hypothetical protein